MPMIVYMTIFGIYKEKKMILLEIPELPPHIKNMTIVGKKKKITF